MIRMSGKVLYSTVVWSGFKIRFYKRRRKDDWTPWLHRQIKKHSIKRMNGHLTSYGTVVCRNNYYRTHMRCYLMTVTHGTRENHIKQIQKQGLIGVNKDQMWERFHWLIQYGTGTCRVQLNASYQKAWKVECQSQVSTIEQNGWGKVLYSNTSKRVKNGRSGRGISNNCQRV